MKTAYGRGVMTFGKFKGELLTEIPEGYLRWLLTDCNSLEESPRAEIERELRGRGGSERGSHGGASQTGEGEQHGGPTSGLPTAVDRHVAAEIISAGRRALALVRHPDVGGDPERMVRVNATADYLETRLALVLGG